MKIKELRRYLMIIKTFGPAGGFRYRFFYAENDERAKDNAFRFKEELRTSSDPDYPIDGTEIARIYQVREVEF